MKTKPKHIRLSLLPIIAVLLTALSSEILAQQVASGDLKDFNITIENTDKGLQFYSDRGSAWVNLSFNIRKGKTQAIDEFGMTRLKNVSTKGHEKLANYLLTVKKSKNSIMVTGIEGTAWKELSFTLPKNRKQTINQFGMAE